MPNNFIIPTLIERRKRIISLSSEVSDVEGGAE